VLGERRLTRLLVCCSAALLLAGCESGDTESRALSHRELIDRLNKSCAEIQPHIDAAEATLKRAVARNDFDGVADASEDALRWLEKGVANLRSLHPPPRDREAFGRFKTAVSKGPALLKRLIVVFRSHGVARDPTYRADLLANRREVRQARKDLGLPRCT
jgi:hypothetical protein